MISLDSYKSEHLNPVESLSIRHTLEGFLQLVTVQCETVDLSTEVDEQIR